MKITDDDTLRAQLTIIRIRQAALSAIGCAVVAAAVMGVAVAPYIHTETEAIVAAGGLTVIVALFGFLIFGLMTREDRP